MVGQVTKLLGEGRKLGHLTEEHCSPEGATLVEHGSKLINWGRNDAPHDVE